MSIYSIGFSLRLPGEKPFFLAAKAFYPALFVQNAWGAADNGTKKRCFFQPI